MAVFFIAMAFLESAVVVYLRALYYPDGFGFPLVPMEPGLVGTEMGRELATLVMLLAPGAAIARSRMERFAWFCIGFGIWDIFYYVWLKILVDWPPSLLEPDLLFLLPVPWVGPVWAPCLIAVGLIVLGCLILLGRSRGPGFRIDRLSWCLLLAGALVMVLSFTMGPWQRAASLGPMDMGPDGAGLQAVFPEDFIMTWYSVGSLLSLWGLYRVWRRLARHVAPQSPAHVEKK